MQDGTRPSGSMRSTAFLLLTSVALLSLSGCGSGHTISAAEEVSVTEGVSAAERAYLVGDQKSAEGYNLHAHQAYSRAMNGALPYAQEGRAAEQVLVGKLYFGGKGVTQDYAEAAKWFQKAAGQGNPEAIKLLPEAQVLVGKLYFGGKDVTQDYAEAAKWFQKAADQGNPEAIKLLPAVAAQKVRKQQEAEAQKVREQQASAAEKRRKDDYAHAQAAEERGDYDEALLLLKQLIEQRGEGDLKAFFDIYSKPHGLVETQFSFPMKDDYVRVLDKQQQAKKENFLKAHYDPKDVVAQVLNYSDFGTDVISGTDSGFWYATSKCVYTKVGFQGERGYIDLNTVDPRTVRIEIAFNSYYFGGGAYYTIHVGDNFQLGDGRAHDRGRLERGWSMIFSQYCKGTKKAF